MTELTRKQKIERLNGFVERLNELGELENTLLAQDAALQKEIEEFTSAMAMEVTLRRDGREGESLLDLEEAKQTLASLQERRAAITKQIDDFNAECEWIEEQVDAIEVS